jgi:hypothetical protein
VLAKQVPNRPKPGLKWRDMRTIVLEPARR